MTDESNNPLPAAGSPESGGEAIVAFCQQCGRGLTGSTRRTLNGGIFCAPCATTHPAEFPPAATAAGAASSAPPPASGYTAVNTGIAGLGPFPPAVGSPNPVLAGLLGLIPGVGAMYNGQYPKGVIHLVIFVILTSLADNLNWVIWWLVWGWIFYQAFEAYHTAQARRDGLVLPDPFGWNDLGERLGFGRAGAVPPSTPLPTQAPTQAPGGTAPAVNPAPPTTSQTAYAAVPAPQTAGYATPGVPVRVTPSVDPSRATTTPPDTFAPGVAPPPAFTSTYTSAPPYAVDRLATVPGSMGQRFPAGAAWLIGLGLLFLLANLAPGWHIEARWLVPTLLASLALWTAGRRLLSARNPQTGGLTISASLPESLIGPALLLTVAILLALQTANVVRLQHSWPTLLIVWGVLLLAVRVLRSSAEFASKPESPPVPDESS